MISAPDKTQQAKVKPKEDHELHNLSLPHTHRKRDYIKQDSAMRMITALAATSCSSRRLSNNGITTSSCLMSWMMPPEDKFELRKTALNMLTTSSITSSSVLWNLKQNTKKNVSKEA